jgi:hypothetical protein
LSTSIGNDIKVGSDVEDGQNMNKGKKTLDLQVNFKSLIVILYYKNNNK